MAAILLVALGGLAASIQRWTSVGTGVEQETSRNARDDQATLDIPVRRAS